MGRSVSFRELYGTSRHHLSLVMLLHPLMLLTHLPFALLMLQALLLVALLLLLPLDPFTLPPLLLLLLFALLLQNLLLSEELDVVLLGAAHKHESCA